MSEYTAARNRTRAKIERAFWDLYLEKKFRRVTVREIVQRAGIHRSTFYIYFQTVEDIFSAIKERQLSLLQEVLATEGEGEGRFIGLLNALQEVYEENRIFLGHRLSQQFLFPRLSADAQGCPEKGRKLS